MRTSLRIAAVASMLAGLLLSAAVMSPLPDADAVTGGCIVGDACVPQRLVSPTARCIRASGGLGATLSTDTKCTNRSFSINEPPAQARFRTNGTILFDTSCLETGGANTAPTLQQCSGAATQQWTLVGNEVRDNGGLCLVEVGQAVETRTCVAGLADDWGFIPMDPTGQYTVKGVYIEATDSAATGRGATITGSLAFVQAQWAGRGYTFTHDPVLISLGAGLACAALPSLQSFRELTVRELSLARQFDLNTKYVVAGECPVAGVANADETISVYAPFILTNATAQLLIDPTTATDGQMAEVGSFGHELGHSLGLNHENCIIGGWQGGVDEGGVFQAQGMPATATKGPMCNGAYFPNVDNFSNYQQDVLWQHSCAWFAECNGVGEFGELGRPFGCATFGDRSPAAFDANAVPNQMQLNRFTYTENAVSTYGPFSNQTGASGANFERTPALYLLKGVKNYFAISEFNAPTGQAVTCGFENGWVAVGPDVDGDGIEDAADTCAATPAQTAVNAAGCPFVAMPAPGGSGYVALAPTRILDSRPGEAGLGANDAFVTPWGAGVTRTVQVTGIAGVPADASAVAMQVTSVSTTANSFLTVWPTGARPLAASKNFGPVAGGPLGHTALTNDLLIVPVGPGGTVQMYNNAGTVDIIADVVGYYRPNAGFNYSSVNPTRILDSRPGQPGLGANDAFVTPWGVGVTRSVQVTGIAGVPADASAVAMQVTSVSTTANSFLTVWPTGTRPLAASKNFGPVAGGALGHAGLTNDLLIVPVGPGGTVQMYNNDGSVDIIADVVGYFSAAGTSTFTPLAPTRILDSRPGQPGLGANDAFATPWGAGVTRSVQTTGIAGVPAGIGSIMVQVTSVSPTADSFLTAWSAGARPLAASKNYGLTVGGPLGHTALTNDLLIVPVAADGTAQFFNNAGTVDMVVDVVGYFMTPVP